MTDNKVNSTVVEESKLAVPAKAKHLSIGKKIGVALSVLAIACCTALSVGATDGETSTNNEIATVMSQSFTTVASDLGNYAITVLPAGLGVFAVTFCVRKGMSFFRTVAH